MKHIADMYSKCTTIEKRNLSHIEKMLEENLKIVVAQMSLKY